MRKDEYHEGQCYGCGEVADVRWKNIYTRGSEGTLLCIDCEMIVVNLLQSMAAVVSKRKLRQAWLNKKRKNTE